jgi:hypothetical protein
MEVEEVEEPMDWDTQDLENIHLLASLMDE